MGDVSHQLVRDFFELSRFRVWPNWHQPPAGRQAGDYGPQLFIENLDAAADASGGGFVLYPLDLPNVARAVVEVRPWHGDRFYPSTVENTPGLTQIFQPETLGSARDFFAGQDFLCLLVISELPITTRPRARSIQLLREAGITHVMEFPSIIQELLTRVNPNLPYTGSPVLQLLRIMKHYRFIRNQQLEFPFTLDPPEPPADDVEATPPAEESQ